MEFENKNEGVLLIAAGNPHYGQMALNLLLAIKATDGYAKVALAHDDYGIGYLTRNELALFDHCLPIDPALYMDGSKAHWGRLKCQLPALSPFDRTIFLDVDSVWFPVKRASDLFQELTGVDFTPQVHCAIPIDAPDDRGICVWANMRDVRGAYDLKAAVRVLSSYFFYFNKNPHSLHFFEKATEICDDLLSGKMPFTGWQNTVPDELCFSLAAGVLGETFPNDEYKPVYEYTNPNPPTRNEMFKNFYAATQCGDRAPAGWKSLYDDLNTYHHRKLKQSRPYKWKDKFRFNKTVYTDDVLRIEKYNRMLKRNNVAHDWFYRQKDGTYNSVDNENFTREQINIIAKAGGYSLTDESGMYIEKSSPKEIHLLIV